MTHERTDWLSRWATYTPEKVALHWLPDGSDWTYETCHRVASGLIDRLEERYGLEKGDRVGVLATNAIETMLLFFACQRAGWVLVPINFRLATPEVAHVLDDSAPRVVFHQDAFDGHVRELEADYPDVRFDTWSGDNGLAALVEAAKDDPTPPPTDGRAALEDPVMILYTSGTTGAPKGAIITHQMLLWNSVNTMLRLDLTTSDVSFNAAPLYHTGGWNVLTTPLIHHGATVILLDNFDAAELLELCDEREITIVWGVPTMMRMMADEPTFEDVSLDSVRYAIVGGEAMPEPLIRTWQDKGVPIRQGFGMTEVGPNCFSLAESDAIRKIGSIGLPNFYVETRLVDDHGDDVATGETGELWMRGPVVSPGYWGRPEATAEALEDGWFKTGDLMRCDEEGYFYVVGRKKEMFISGGENVYPVEVEKVFHAHDAIADCAVVGVPDARWGEVGAAFVVPQEGADLDAEALTTYAREHLARYKVPKYFYFRDALPVGDSGKIQKVDLQKEATALVKGS